MKKIEKKNQPTIDEEFHWEIYQNMLADPENQEPIDINE